MSLTALLYPRTRVNFLIEMYCMYTPQMCMCLFFYTIVLISFVVLFSTSVLFLSLLELYKKLKEIENQFFCLFVQICVKFGTFVKITVVRIKLL